VTVIVILGFHLKGDYPEKLEKQLIPFLKNKKQKKEDWILVITGGHTDPYYPRQSEAMVILNFLMEKMIYPEAIYLETQSITTFQNLLFLAKNKDIQGLFQNIKPADSIIFAGEAGSKKEVLFLASHLLKRYNVRIEYYPLYLYPEEKRKQKEKKYYLTVASYYFPPLYFWFSCSRWLEKRKLCWKIRRKICATPFSWGCDRCKI